MDWLDEAAIAACKAGGWPTAAQLFPECVANLRAIPTELPVRRPNDVADRLPLFELSGHRPAGMGGKTRFRFKQDRKAD
jgi:hypothetical protein